MRIFILLLLIIASQVCSALPVVEKKEPAPCVIVIFGATGDLTARKLVPGIYNLAHEGNLSENSAVIGFARRKYTHETFRSEMHQAVEKFSRTKMDNVFWNTFEKKVFYNQSDLLFGDSA
jgi:glucose-6-phosphate 1-dehydrogenase